MLSAYVIPLILLLAAVDTTAAGPTMVADKLGMAAGERRLIQTSANIPPRWMMSADIMSLYEHKTHFMDVTETQDLGRGAGFRTAAAPAIPVGVSQQAIVWPMIARATTELMRSTLTKLTEFNTRYYKSPTGAASSEWLFGQIKALVADANKAALRVTVTQVVHSFPQKSIIARIEGMNGNTETVIIGAHQDSINGQDPMKGRSPGADDDGSGTVTILEAFRVVLTAGYQPLRPLEFHWYAGEEGGLLGSQAIARQYVAEKRVVAGMLQLDMTMYPTQATKDIGILTDYVNPQLTAFLRTLVPAYTSLPAKDFRCGYGCSDHASWNRAGFPSAMSFESSSMHANDNIHTTRDTLDTLDYEHGLQLAKIAAAFAVEMSHA